MVRFSTSPVWPETVSAMVSSQTPMPCSPMKLRKLPGLSVGLRAGDIAFAVVFIDVGVLIGNRVNRREGMVVEHGRLPAMAEGAEEVGKTLVPDFVGDDDAADRDGCRGDGDHIGHARPGRGAIRDDGGQVDAAQNPIAVLVLLAEGQQTEHTHKGVFGGFLVLRLNADVIEGSRRDVAVNERPRPAAAERLVGGGEGRGVQVGQAGIGGNIEVNVRLGPGGIVQVGLVHAEARQREVNRLEGQEGGVGVVLVVGQDIEAPLVGEAERDDAVGAAGPGDGVAVRQRRLGAHALVEQERARYALAGRKSYW